MLEALRRIVVDVSSAPDSRTALNLIVARVKAEIGCDVCSVYIADERRAEHVLVASDGLRPDAVGAVRLPRTGGLVGLVAARAEPVNLDDASAHPSYQFVPKTGEAPFHGFLGVPVILARRVLGVLVVQQSARRRFGDDEGAFLVTLAAQVAGVLAQIEVAEYLKPDTGSLGPGKAASRNVILSGTDSVRGVAVGSAVAVRTARVLATTPDRVADDVELELARFRSALQTEIASMRAIRLNMAPRLAEADLALFDAYILILEGGSFAGEVATGIASGNWAPGAVRHVIDRQANQLQALDDPYIRTRADDLRDLGERLLRRLRSTGEQEREYPARVVLVGEDVTATDITDVPVACLSAVVSASGTSASHVAVLARGMGIPAVFGVGNLPVAGLEGLEIVVDGYSGRVCIEPRPQLRREYLRLELEEQALSRDLERLRDHPCATADAHPVSLMANTALFADIAAARQSGAAGIGLYRSEMHFAVRDRFPGETEQAGIYRRVIRMFSPYPVSLRTLDIGGDKALPYFPINEANPYLGWRGMRVTLDHPEIFLTQLRAMLRAGEAGDRYRILFPMISQLPELDEALGLLARARAELLEEGIPVGNPEVGVMVEVPAVLYQVEAYARRVDALSIGTNDLTQYLLATDRTNSRVAALYSGLHPAVLKAIGGVAEQAAPLGCPVAVCGELAGDPAGCLLMVGLGIDSLSTSHASLNKVKWVLKSFTLNQAQRLAQEAVALESPAEVEALLSDALDRAGLGALIRAGR